MAKIGSADFGCACLDFTQLRLNGWARLGFKGLALLNSTGLVWVRLGSAELSSVCNGSLLKLAGLGWC